MAEGKDSSEERSLDPTPKRLLEARKKGQVARSRELNTTVMLLTSSAALFLMGSQASTQVLELIGSILQIDRNAVFDVNSVTAELTNAIMTALIMLLPLFFIMICACIFAPVLVGGFAFSTESFAPKFSRMNPLSGLQRMFGLQGLMELIKSVLKVALLMLVTWWLFYIMAERYLMLGSMPPAQGVATALGMIIVIFSTLSAATMLVAAIDVPYVKWDHIRKLRMTRQEMKEESKESDGNPEVRGKVRQMQQEVANRKMLTDVRNSDVVIINPTHFSVALKYDLEGQSAPVVVAKGVDHMALAIREIAREHDVPMFRNVTLARSLYHNVKMQQEIPVDLYNAIAQVLAYVYQLRDFKNGEAMEPVYPEFLSLPNIGNR
ncbi:MAG: flagellar biosynthesis protein FlhB [Pseudomonadota bacterium]